MANAAACWDLSSKNLDDMRGLWVTGSSTAMAYLYKNVISLLKLHE